MKTLCLLLTITLTIALPLTAQDTTGPAGSTFTINRTLVRPAELITATFSGWTDASVPLSYQVKVDGSPIGVPSGNSTFGFGFAAPDGLYPISGVVRDALGNITEVQGLSVLVDGTPPVITAPPVITLLAHTPAGAMVDVAVLGFTVTDNLDPVPVVTFDRPVPFSLPPNSYTNFTITATDAAGNVARVQVGISALRAYVETRVAAQAGRLGGVNVGTVLDDAPGFQLTSLGTPSLSNLTHIIATGAAKDATGAKLGGILMGRSGFYYDVAAFETRWTMPLRAGTPAEEVGPGLLWRAFPREPFMGWRDDAFPQATSGFFTRSAAVPVVFGFHGRVSGPGVTAASDDVLGYFRGQPGGDGIPEVRNVVAVAREGGPAPGVTRGTFKTFLSAALALKVVGAGELDFGGNTFPPGLGLPGPLPGIAFTAMLNHGPGVDSGSDMGLWFWEDDMLRLVLREGHPLPNTGTIPEGPAVKSFTALRGPGGALSADTNPHHFLQHASVEQLSTTVTDYVRGRDAPARRGERPRGEAVDDAASGYAVGGVHQWGALLDAAGVVPRPARAGGRARAPGGCDGL